VELRIKWARLTVYFVLSGISEKDLLLLSVVAIALELQRRD